MIFYHLELAKNKKIKLFQPRIPDERLEDEDSITPRVCVSKTLEGCLNAVPWGRSHFNLIPKCLPIRVYVFETNDYLDSKYLVDNKLVKDAIYTDECWLLDEIEPIDIFYILNIKPEYKTINLANGKTYTYFTKIDYDIAYESDFRKIIYLGNINKYDLSNEDFEFACLMILEFFFDIQGNWIDDVKFENNYLIIDSEFLFSEYEFIKKLQSELKTRELIEDFLG